MISYNLENTRILIILGSHTGPDSIHFVQKLFFGLNGVLGISKEYLYNKKSKWRILLHQLT